MHLGKHLAAIVLGGEKEAPSVSFRLPSLQASRQVNSSTLKKRPVSHCSPCKDLMRRKDYSCACICSSSIGPVRLSHVCYCSCKCSHATFMEQAQRHGTYTKETLQFMEKILSTSGLGEETYMPASMALCCTFAVQHRSTHRRLIQPMCSFGLLQRV